MTPEGHVKAMVQRRMKQAFPLAYRFMPVQNGMGAPALDFYWCIHGLFVAFETKVPGKNATDRQKITMAEIHAAGGLAFVIHDATDFEKAIAEIEAKADRRCSE